MSSDSSSFDLLVRGGVCVTPAATIAADLGIRDGKIAAIGELGDADAATVLEARGLTILPGVIDPHVHFREPGGEHKEDFESGSRAAVLGGVTVAFEMPNSRPATISAEALDDKLRRAEGRFWCDYAFYVGATPANAESLAALERHPGCCGIKIYMGSSTGDLLVSRDADVLRVLRSGFRRVSVHCEDEPRLLERKALIAGKPDPALHPVWRDAEAARLAAERLLRLARQAGRRVHILHVSTADEVDLVARHRDLATLEVTPQHLTLEAPGCYERLGTLAQMNPPIRDALHREGLWEGIRLGIIDTLGSDHAPHTREEKSKPYAESPSGMPGVQTMLPLMLNHVHDGRLTLRRLVDLTCAGPARVYGIAGKGRLAVGYDADLTLVDLEAERTIQEESIASLAGWTPFNEAEVTGWPIATVVRGHIVMRDGQMVDKPAGRPARFGETLAPEQG